MTQHAHIYSFHTSHFDCGICYSEIFINTAPSGTSPGTKMKLVTTWDWKTHFSLMSTQSSMSTKEFSWTKLWQYVTWSTLFFGIKMGLLLFFDLTTWGAPTSMLDGGLLLKYQSWMKGSLYSYKNGMEQPSHAYEVPQLKSSKDNQIRTFWCFTDM